MISSISSGERLKASVRGLQKGAQCMSSERQSQSPGSYGNRSCIRSTTLASRNGARV